MARVRLTPGLLGDLFQLPPGVHIVGWEYEDAPLDLTDPKYLTSSEVLELNPYPHLLVLYVEGDTLPETPVGEQVPEMGVAVDELSIGSAKRRLNYQRVTLVPLLRNP